MILATRVSWWCAAGTGPWTWEPQAYPGIWLFMALLGAAYLLGLRRAARHGTDGVASIGQQTSFWIGYALLWLVLDWPLGTLAAGYLLSAHMTQYLLISLVIVPLLVGGLPPAAFRMLVASRALAPIGWFLERPFASFVAFNGIMLATHVPIVADTLKPLQFGSMAMDLVWILGAFLFWGSLRTADAGERLTTMLGKRVLFIFAIKIPPVILGVFFVFASFPIFETYEFAARAVEMTPHADQVLAGLLVWMATSPIIVWRLGEAFFRWYQIEQGEQSV